MSRVLERIPLGVRLGALVAVPLLVIALEAGARVRDVGAEHAAAVSFSAQADQAASIDRAIRAIQVERDLTVQYYTLEPGASGRAALAPGIEAAREESRLAIVAADLSETIPLDDLKYEPELQSARPAPPDDQPRPAPGGGGEGETGDGRRLTSGGRTTTPEAPRWNPSTLSELYDLAELHDPSATRVSDVYTTLIGEYQSALMAAAGIDDGTVPASYLVSYHNVVLAREQFAQLRVGGLILLESDNPDAGEVRALGQISDQERFFLKQAEGTARPAERRVLNELLGAPTVLSLDEVKLALLRATGTTEDVTRDTWLGRTTVRLDALTDVADAFQAELLAQVDSSVSQSRRQYARILVGSVLVVLAVAVSAWLVTRSISGPLHRLSVAARNASVGRLWNVDAPASKDAIGEIGRAYRELVAYMAEVSQSAEQIARGELRREIRPRSEEDRLGTALQTMTRQLSGMVTRSRQRSRELADTVDVLQETVARDSLTGLVSRARFEGLLAEQVVKCRPKGRPFGVLFIDLDGFKPVNDRLGHDAGDELLREVAQRLTGAVRDHDVVARLGGDEFTILIDDPRSIDTLRQTARRVVEIVRLPYSISGKNVRIGASVGLARFPDHGPSARELLRAADAAMYAVKHSGGGDMRVAEPDSAA